MTTTLPNEQAIDPASDTALYQEIQHFYSRQMRAMDSGDTTAWAQSFTADGVFEANAHAEPMVGHEVIERTSRQATEALRERGIQRRHWLGMLQVDAGEDGTIRTQTYAQILETTVGAGTHVRSSTTCDDVLVRVDGALKVRHRTVRRDDLA